MEAEDKVLSLVRMQSFDGSFSPTKELALILEADLFSQAETLGVDGKVWATLLAVAFMKKNMSVDAEILDDLVEKALGYVKTAYSGEVGALLSRAADLIDEGSTKEAPNIA